MPNHALPGHRTMVAIVASRARVAELGSLSAMTTLVFYRGYGFVPIALLFLCGLAATVLGFDTHNRLVLSIAIIAAGFLTGASCAALKIRDSRAGRDFRLVSTQHTFMFIPVVFYRHRSMADVPLNAPN